MSATNITRRDYNEWLEFCAQVQNSTAVAFNDTEELQKIRIKRALTEYNYFVTTYFDIYADADCADFHIDFANACLADPNFFGIAEWAREHAKSVHLTIIIPMWLIAHKQLTGMLLMGKNEDDACNLLSDLQAQLQSNKLFAHDFGEQYNFGSWEDGDFTTKEGIRFLAFGRDQSPRGARENEKRPNYGVVDDVDDDDIVHNPKRVDKIVKKILGAMYFALSIKGARFAMGGNRIHHNSILANIVGDTKPGAKKREGIYHSKVKAIENGRPAWWQRYSLQELLRKIQRAGPVLAKQEFFHETDIEGKIFKNKYFRFAKLPHLAKMDIIIGYFDPSFENNQTSDFKAVSLWGQNRFKRFCIKRFTRRCELEDVFEWMIKVEKDLPPGVGIIWYMEKQFYTRPVKKALRRVCKKLKYPLSVLTDERKKPNKYTRMVRMEPEYSSGNVIYNVEEEHDPDMVEGNLQLKGIEPGYNTADDAPDADEGAWFYLDQHQFLDAEDLEQDALSLGKHERDEENTY
ncbi:hypothetical protein IW15_10115 [Chryseobacterium soli]|uniref:Uncharacterized protein n=1 Tax=Chryseobacterium soli TaxID=445961 RepID=A0A086A8U4_9FLAO|nr:hypothetical protein [Chryseobacterium soli]KFF13108.1 hypothetical protein IW15_10115 [Chryseobacterium soli]